MSGRRLWRRAHNTSGPSDGVGASNTRRCETSDREPFRRRTPEGLGVRSEVSLKGRVSRTNDQRLQGAIAPRRRFESEAFRSPRAAGPLTNSNCRRAGPGVRRPERGKAQGGIGHRCDQPVAPAARTARGDEAQEPRPAPADVCALRSPEWVRRPRRTTRRNIERQTRRDRAAEKRQVGPSGGNAATPAGGSNAAKGRTPGAPPVPTVGSVPARSRDGSNVVAEHLP